MRNEIKNLSGDQEITRDNIGGNNPVNGAVTRTVAGEAVGSFYGLIVDGIFQTQGEIDALNESAPGGVYQTNGTRPPVTSVTAISVVPKECPTGRSPTKTAPPLAILSLP